MRSVKTDSTCDTKGVIGIAADEVVGCATDARPRTLALPPTRYPTFPLDSANT